MKLTEENKDKKQRRRVIKKLVCIKKELLQEAGDINEVNCLTEVLREEYDTKKIDIHMFVSCAYAIQDYVDGAFIEDIGKKDKLDYWQEYFCDNDKPLATFLEKKKVAFDETFFCKGKDFLKKFEDGTFSKKTVMGYTKWLLELTKKFGYVQEISVAFRIFEVYVREFLQLKRSAEDKKPFFNAQSVLIECIDDIIEDYIEIVKPSAYFLACLSQIGEE